MQCEEFYTYVYYDPLRNNTPIYVGKGCNERAWIHLSKTKINVQFRNRLRTLKKNNIKPVIGIYAGLSEELSLFLEEELIFKFGRRDLGTGTLYNLSTGGDGARNGPESCKKISNALLGKKKSATHKLNISKSMKGKPGRSGSENPMFGKILSKESVLKRTESRRRNMSKSVE